MNKRKQKLQSYIDKYFGKTDTEIMDELGIPVEGYFGDILIYVKAYKIFLRDETAFFIKDGIVIDIAITECFLSIGLRNVFYYKDEKHKYKVVKLF